MGISKKGSIQNLPENAIARDLIHQEYNLP